MRTEPVDDEPDIQREDEDVRQERWDEFLAFARNASVSVLLRYIADAMADRTRADFHNERIEAYRRLVDFAETEDWSGTLSAIAQAQRERERSHRELMDRR